MSFYGPQATLKGHSGPRRGEGGASTGSFYQGGSRPDRAGSRPDRPERPAPQLAMQREILAGSAEAVLALVEQRSSELDGANFATALQRVAKLGDRETRPQLQVLLAGL